MSVPFQLPPMSAPARYTGLYVVQFAHGVAVGYTADEVATLLRETEYRDVAVFRVHRVDESGRFELAGVHAHELGGVESMIFASHDPERARRDLAALQRLAADNPLPVGVRAELVDFIDFEPSHGVCLLYTRPASTMVSNWLLAAGFNGGDAVHGGPEAERIRQSAAGEPIASVLLPARIEHASRTREQVLAAVRDPLQR